MIIADRRGIVSAKWMRLAPWNYGIASIAILVAVFFRHSVGPGLGFNHPFIVFCPVIVALALWSSVRVALFATFASAIAATYLFLEPPHSFGIGNPGDIVGLLLFLAVGVTISAIGDQFRRRTKRLQEFEKAIEGVQEMILVLDRDYRYLIANETFLRYTGRKRDHVLGRTVSEIVGPDIFQSLKPKMDECFKGKPVQFEFRKKYVNRGERDILVSYFPIPGAAGVDRITVVLQDLTEQRRMEAALRRREQEYREFVVRSSEGIFREELSEPVSIDLPEEELIEEIRCRSSVTECNDALARMYGYESSAEVVGKRLADMLVPGDAQNLELMRAFIRGGFQVVEHLSNEVDSQGNRKVFRNSMTGIVEDRKLIRTWGIQSDVTEQVRAEECRISTERALRASEVHFRELVEQASDGIFIADRQGRYLDVNTAGAEMLGYTRDEVLRLSIADIVVSQELDRIATETHRLTLGGTTRSEWMFRRKDGSLFPGDVAARQLTDGRLQAIVRDVTDRKMAEGRDAAE